MVPKKYFTIKPFEAPQRSSWSTGTRRVEELKVFGRKYLTEKLSFFFHDGIWTPSFLPFLNHRRFYVQVNYRFEKCLWHLFSSYKKIFSKVEKRKERKKTWYSSINLTIDP